MEILLPVIMLGFMFVFRSGLEKTDQPEISYTVPPDQIAFIPPQPLESFDPTKVPSNGFNFPLTYKDLIPNC